MEDDSVLQENPLRRPPVPVTDVRHERRFAVDQPVRVTLLQTPEIRLVGRIRNVSSSGMRLAMECAVAARSAVKIEWDSYLVLGSVCYCNAEKANYVAGVELFSSWESLTAELLASERAELARSNEDLKQFAYVVSHDLKEPLRMVTSYLQLLARRYRGKLDGEADEFIGYALDGAERMERLLTDILSYSRVTGRPAELALVDAGEALKTALANLGPAIAEARARVTAGALPTVLANRSQMIQLFQNLVGNGIKFRGAAEPEVHVSAERNPAEWVFSVRDNGIGIAAEHWERIFQMFERLHTRKEYPGNGIGLAIARRVVERFGGRMWLQSELGRGSVFFFTVPEREWQAA